MSERAPIYTPEMQLQKIKDTKDLKDYLNLDKAFFDDRSPMMRDYATKVLGSTENSSNPEYYIFASVISLLIAEFGYWSQDGLVFRYSGKYFGNQRDAFSSRKMLYVGSYFGSMNMQSVPIKERMAKEISAILPNVSDGIHGLPLPAEDGNVSEEKSMVFGLKRWIERSRDRLDEIQRPICIVNEPLNSALRDLGFSMSDAENMSSAEFSEVVYPKAEEIFDGIVDISPVFNEKRRRPIMNRTYSI